MPLKELISMPSLFLQVFMLCLSTGQASILSACIGLLLADSLSGKMSQRIQRAKGQMIRGGNEHHDIVTFHALV